MLRRSNTLFARSHCVLATSLIPIYLTHNRSLRGRDQPSGVGLFPGSRHRRRPRLPAAHSPGLSALPDLLRRREIRPHRGLRDPLLARQGEEKHPSQARWTTAVYALCAQYRRAFLHGVQERLLSELPPGHARESLRVRAARQGHQGTVLQPRYVARIICWSCHLLICVCCCAECELNNSVLYAGCCPGYRVFQALKNSCLLSHSVPAAAGVPRAPLRSLQAEEVPDVQEHQVLRRRPLRHLRAHVYPIVPVRA